MKEAFILSIVALILISIVVRRMSKQKDNGASYANSEIRLDKKTVQKHISRQNSSTKKAKRPALIITGLMTIILASFAKMRTSGGVAALADIIVVLGIVITLVGFGVAWSKKKPDLLMDEKDE